MEWPSFSCIMSAVAQMTSFSLTRESTRKRKDMSTNMDWVVRHDSINLSPTICNNRILQHIFDSVKQSLERLQLDYVDVLQCMISGKVIKTLLNGLSLRRPPFWLQHADWWNSKFVRRALNDIHVRIDARSSRRCSSRIRSLHWNVVLLGLAM